ncbi:CBS domain-containing protein [Streptomyces sp. NPDC058067]|uniref:CBS domain-containing protein n=1 Tax=Streptomyces sp. NPDC058067 TaxID=3346324 RepID=UPI0036E8DBCB
MNAEAPQARTHTTVSDVMYPLGEVVTAAPEDPVLDLLPRLEESSMHRALVLDHGRLVGILAVADITRALAWPTPAAHPRHDGPRRHRPAA